MTAAASTRAVHRQHEVRDVDTELALQPLAAEHPQVARLPHPMTVQHDGPGPGPVAVPEEVGVGAPVWHSAAPSLRTRQVDGRLVLADERQVFEVDAGPATTGDAYLGGRAGHRVDQARIVDRADRAQRAHC